MMRQHVDATALAAAAVTVAEAARRLLPPAQTACCGEPDVQHGLYCGVQLDEPTCMACGVIAPSAPMALLPEPAAIALAAAIAGLRTRVGVGGAPAGEGDDVDLGDDAQAAVTRSDTSGFVGMDARNTYLCDGFLYSQRDQVCAFRQTYLPGQVANAVISCTRFRISSIASALSNRTPGPGRPGGGRAASLLLLPKLWLALPDRHRPLLPAARRFGGGR
jgi:hypothetical protein